MASASTQVWETPELLEQIFSYLLLDLEPRSVAEPFDEPRSARTLNNARVLLQLLRCSQVASTWQNCIFKDSRALQRALFLLPDHGLSDASPNAQRSWWHAKKLYRNQRDFYTNLAERSPALNPMIQYLYSSYHLRLWRSGLEAMGSKHRAYLIVNRRYFEQVRKQLDDGQGGTFANMLLSQPPMTAIQAHILERDPASEPAVPTRYPSHTSYGASDDQIANGLIECEDPGVTLGLIHRRVRELFDANPHVLRMKLTTA